MTDRARSLLIWVLCGLMAATGQTMTTARGASAATGQMVICTGQGPVPVYTDASGQPTGAPLLCPDCVLHLFTALLPEATQAIPAQGSSETPSSVATALPAFSGSQWHQPRAPPPVS
jgi:hypothetical protein